jgi:hypothetical protein
MTLPEGFRPPARDLCASQLDDNDFKVFVLDGDGRIWESTQFGTLNGTAGLPVTEKVTSMASCFAGRRDIDMAIVTGEGVFCQAWQPGSGFRDSRRVGGEGGAIVDVACARSHSLLLVFTLDRHGRIWCSWSGSARDWSQWQAVPGPAAHVTGIAASNSDRLSALIAVADDGTVWHTRYELGAGWDWIDWSSLDQLSGTQRSAPQKAARAGLRRR